MNREQILNTMEHIDPALIEGMEVRRTGRRLPRAVRTGLVAACLCAALVGTAFAVEVATGKILLRYFSADEYNEIMETVDPGFQPGEDAHEGIVLTKDELGVSLDGISAEALAFAREREGKGEPADREFATLEEAEAFLGMDFYDNAMMDSLAAQDYIGPELYDDEGNLVQLPRDGGVSLLCCPDSGGMAWVQMFHFATSGDGDISVSIDADAVSHRIAGSGGTSTVIYEAGTQLTEEVFSTAWGADVPIVRCDFPESELREVETMFQSYFNVYGVEYAVTVRCAENAELGAEIIKEVINAFVFKENP